MIPAEPVNTGLQEAERTRMGAAYRSPYFINLPDPVLPEIGHVRIGWRPGYQYDPSGPADDLFDFLSDLFRGKK